MRSFVVRLWTAADERGVEPLPLRGVLEEVATGETVRFAGGEQLLAALERAARRQAADRPESPKAVAIDPDTSRWRKVNMDPIRRQIERLRGIFPLHRRRILAGGAVAVSLAIATVFVGGSFEEADTSLAAGSGARHLLRPPVDLSWVTRSAPKKPTASPTVTPTATPTATPTPTPTGTPAPTPLPVPAAGAVWSWGGNNSGQLGRGTQFVSEVTPGPVGGVGDIKAIAAPVAGNHSVALKSDGTVWAWGSNSHGQLGDGTVGNESLTPLQVAGLSGVTAVAGGRFHSLALNADGSVTTWGDSLTVKSVVSGLTGVVAIAAGDNHSLALKGDGTVWSWWGSDANGKQMSGLSGAVAVAAGAQHSLVLKGDGTVWAWGVNEFGQCGDADPLNKEVPVPFQVPGLADVTAIAAGARQSMALKADGTVWAWGQNTSGQLGDGTYVGRATVAAVSGLGDVTAIAGGRLHALALKSDGTVWVWGDDSANPSPLPAKVGLPASLSAKVTRIAASQYHSLVLFGAP